MLIAILRTPTRGKVANRMNCRNGYSHDGSTITVETGIIILPGNLRQSQYGAF